MSGGRSILVVDDHPLILDAAERIFRDHGFDVVGKSRTARGGLEILNGQRVDVVVLDLNLPGEDVTASLQEIRSRWPETVIVILSGFDDDERIRGALRHGAAAYVTKSADPDDLVAAVRQALQPSVFFARTPAPAPEPEDSVDSLDLTKREIEILRLVADGRSNADVGRMLWVTEQTVKFHLSNIYRKLGVSNRTQASRYAQLHGLLRA